MVVQNFDSIHSQSFPLVLKPISTILFTLESISNGHWCDEVRAIHEISHGLGGVKGNALIIWGVEYPKY